MIGKLLTPVNLGNKLSIALLSIFICACSPAENPDLFPEYSSLTAVKVPSKPLVSANPDGQVFWGDLHIHTSLSTDAYTMGVRALPDDAYTFAKGGEIAHAVGYGIKLGKPLDFAAVTDHSEYLGVLHSKQPENPLSSRPLRERLLNDSPLRNTIMFLRSASSFNLKNSEFAGSAEISRDAWRLTIDSAERHNAPGRFTAFVGYEWSSMPNSKNLHRNVIYRSANTPDLPYSSLESTDPRDLWTALESQRERGIESIAIPHNGNVSGGLMYDSVAYDGSAMNEEYAQRRIRNEPISEIFQVKGSSETHPLLSPKDEFAGFEIYDKLLSQKNEYSEPKGSYIRDALRLGMEMSHDKNFNPYQFGVIGASDGHNASSPVEEDNYHGKLPLLDGSASIRLRTAYYLPDDRPGGAIWSAAGLAGVWASENTREALFDAMRRKETYATSGPRITVRFFGAWKYPDDLLQRSDWVTQAKRHGVPMGGELASEHSATKAPSFAVWASQDPDSGRLDRIQIVKGWVDHNGESHEKVFDVVWSGKRSRTSANEKLEAVGNTVNVETASYTNTIGAAQLQTLWTDPEFDASQQAFYYARVIEIPTPRWSTFDAVALDIKVPDPASIQERAVTSAIWYRPTHQLMKR